MRPRGSQSLLEERRCLGIGLLRKGLSLDEVSSRIGCHASSVFRWRQAYRRSGRLGLKAKPIPGRPRKLAAGDLARLVTLLGEGPQDHGYKTERWTTARIAKLIRKHFGVRYHRDHIGRLMTSLNWTYLRPAIQGPEDERSIDGNGIRANRSGVSKLVRGWVPVGGSSVARVRQGA